MPRPRTPVSGNPVPGLLIGAALGGLTSRTSDDAASRALIGGLLGGIIAGQTRHAPLPLDTALRQEMNSLGLTFISIDRIGTRAARVSFHNNQGYKTIESHSTSSTSDQDTIDDDLFDKLIQRAIHA